MIDFDKLLDEITSLLEQWEKVSYRGLKRRFDLDDDDLEDIRAELIDAREVAIDIDGRILALKKPKNSPENPTETDDTIFQLSSDIERNNSLNTERRFITVLFCDLVGSTEIADRLDPEDLREIIQRYQQSCTDVIDRYEGYVAQYLGDGILVYYGYPRAHEDDAIRSCLTAIDILETIQSLNKSIMHNYGVSLSVRIGIHSGLTVCGEMGSGNKVEQLAIGDVPNIASRIQSLAGSNEILISYETEKLIVSEFISTPLPAQTLKGVAEPIQLFRLDRPKSQTGFGLNQISDLSPLINRNKEKEILYALWNQVNNGQGHIINICAEAGTGKTRLVDHFFHTCMPRPKNILCFQCSQHHQNTAFFPVTNAFELLFSIEKLVSPKENLKRIRHAISHRIDNFEDRIKMIAPLFNVPLPDSYTPDPLMSPQRKREKLLSGLVDIIQSISNHSPLLIIFDDLQWIDPSTLELLNRLLSSARDHPIMTILLNREIHDELPISSQPVTRIELKPLTEAHSIELIQQLTDTDKISTETLNHLVERTDGNPLYIEELIRSFRQNDTLEIGNENIYHSIPASLQASFTARLDSVGTAKQIAQIASCIGRTCSYELLQSIISNKNLIDSSIDTLVNADILISSNGPYGTEFTFKHALLRDTAHESILKKPRQIYHGEIARHLIRQFSGQTSDEIIAYHYEEAKQFESAAIYYSRAGDRAALHFHNKEAENHYRQALEMALELSDPEERANLELEILLKLGSILITTSGFGSDTVESIYSRAEELCAETSNPSLLFSATAGLETFNLFRARYLEGIAKSEKLIEIAKQSDDDGLFVHGSLAMATNLYWKGELLKAEKYFLKAIEHYQFDRHHQRILQTSRDLGVASHCHYSTLSCFLGKPKNGEQHLAEGFSIAHRLKQPFSIGYALASASHFHMINRNPEKTLEAANENIALSSKEGFQYWLYQGLIHRGWSLSQLGDIKEAIKSTLSGLEALRKIGAFIWRPQQFVILANTYLMDGQIKRALNMITKAIRSSEQTNWDYFESEVYRNHAEILKASGYGDEQEIRNLYLKALVAARRQHNILYEIRALKGCAQFTSLPGETERYIKDLNECMKKLPDDYECLDFIETRQFLTRPAYRTILQKTTEPSAPELSKIVK